MTHFGLSYRHPHRRGLLEEGGPPEVEVLEIIPDHFFAKPEHIEPLAGRFQLLFHDVGLSMGTVMNEVGEDIEEEHLEHLLPLVERAKPLLFTEHLALTRSPSGIDLGHLAPVWMTEESLVHVGQRVASLREILGVEIALENIAWPFVLPGAQLSEGAFFTALHRQWDCGMLLDLTNLLYNARNFGFDPKEALETYPLEAVRVVHLAGGHRKADWWVDSHSHPVEEEAFALLASIRQRAKRLVAVIVERDNEIPPLSELCEELRWAARFWREHGDGEEHAVL